MSYNRTRDQIRHDIAALQPPEKDHTRSSRQRSVCVVLLRYEILTMEGALPCQTFTTGDSEEDAVSQWRAEHPWIGSSRIELVVLHERRHFGKAGKYYKQIGDRMEPTVDTLTEYLRMTG